MTNRVYAHQRAVRNLTFVIPRNFHAKEILPKELHRYADCAHYLIDLIIRRQEMGFGDEDGYVNAKVEFLRNIIPKRIERTIRTTLVAVGVLYCDDHYVPRVYSMSYRIGQAYVGHGLRSVPCADEKLRDRVFAIRERQVFTSIRLPVHRHLRDWMYRLNIDVAGARREVLNNSRLLPEVDLWMHSIDRLENLAAPGNLSFCYCKYGRVHTNVTRIPREIRKYLRMGGEPLVGIDIRNAQPLLIYLYCIQSSRKFAFVPDLHERTKGDRGKGSGEGTKGEKTKKPPIMMDHSFEQVSQVIENNKLAIPECATSDEFEKYRILCESGTFYEYLQERSGESMNREDFKCMCYAHIFYGSNNIHSPMTRLFGREFPEVFTVIKKAKQKDYARLACQMQHIESDLMIHGVCGSLMQTCPQAPLITIHDAIYTTSAYVQTVHQAITSTFAGVGLHPSLKVERPAAQAACGLAGA